MRIVTGFHAIEEVLKAIEAEKSTTKTAGIRIQYAKPGPRVKKILAAAEKLSIPATETKEKEIDVLVKNIPLTAQDHRGIVLIMEHAEQEAPLQLDECLKGLSAKENALVLILDSITDPQNVGAIIRSADQFGVDLVIIPETRSSTDFEVIARTSSGAASWVQIVLTPNLVRATELLKKEGFWIYGADAGGESLVNTDFANKTALIMGSEGSGIARLLREKCDKIVSIPTQGKLDSLNVSVAAGILLYEIRRS